MSLKTFILLGKSGCHNSSLKVICWKNPFLFQGGQSFALLGPSDGWIRPTYITQVNLLYLKSTSLNVNVIKKPKNSTETSRIFDHISGHHVPAKLTNKINHHRDSLQKYKSILIAIVMDSTFLTFDRMVDFSCINSKEEAVTGARGQVQWNQGEWLPYS